MIALISDQPEIERTEKVDEKVQGKTLIVCPTCIIDQWEREIELKTKNRLNVYKYHGSNLIKSPAALATYDVVITSYGMLSSTPGKKKEKTQRKRKRGRGRNEKITTTVSNLI